MPAGRPSKYDPPKMVSWSEKAQEQELAQFDAALSDLMMSLPDDMDMKMPLGEFFQWVDQNYAYVKDAGGVPRYIPKSVPNEIR